MKHMDALKTVKNAKGQLDAVIKMLEEERYCMDISTQLLAAQALISKANKEILTEHLNHCVRESFSSDDIENKIDEINTLLKKVL